MTPMELLHVFGVIFALVAFFLLRYLKPRWPFLALAVLAMVGGGIGETLMFYNTHIVR